MGACNKSVIRIVGASNKRVRTYSRVIKHVFVCVINCVMVCNKDLYRCNKRIETFNNMV